MMIEINKIELYNTNGGVSISGTLINAFTSGIKQILELGRSVGTATRRILANNICPV